MCLTVIVSDFSEADILKYMEEGTHIIHAVVAAGESILVHCQAGVSRSATMIAAYLIKYLGFSVSAAVDMVKTARPIANPNKGFMRQLEVWQKVAQQDQGRQCKL